MAASGGQAASTLDGDSFHGRVVDTWPSGGPRVPPGPGRGPLTLRLALPARHSARRRPLLRTDPAHTAPEVLLLPDRHRLLQPVDQPVTGREGLGTVCRRDRDADARLAHR